jgi:hypothetical protein
VPATPHSFPYPIPFSIDPVSTANGKAFAIQQQHQGTSLQLSFQQQSHQHPHSQRRSLMRALSYRTKLRIVDNCLASQANIIYTRQLGPKVGVCCSAQLQVGLSELSSFSLHLNQGYTIRHPISPIPVVFICQVASANQPTASLIMVGVEILPQRLHLQLLYTSILILGMSRADNLRIKPPSNSSTSP